MSATRRRMIRGADRLRPACGNAESKTSSMTLEIVERLAAAPAAPQRLAGRRAEFREQFGIVGAALRTGDDLLAEQRTASTAGLRRCDAIFLQLAAPVVA